MFICFSHHKYNVYGNFSAGVKWFIIKCPHIGDLHRLSQRGTPLASFHIAEGATKYVKRF